MTTGGCKFGGAGCRKDCYAAAVIDSQLNPTSDPGPQTMRKLDKQAADLIATGQCARPDELEGARQRAKSYRRSHP